MDLTMATNEELEAELERRERIRKVREDRPKPKHIYDLQEVVNTCETLMDEYPEACRIKSYYKERICEQFLEALYGKEVWNWMNSLV
jgi:hypothetical protein